MNKITMTHIAYGPYEKYLKRPLDCIIATGALVVLSPIMLITATLVRIKLGKPVIFVQERPGQIDLNAGRERIFKLYKFRTMTDERGSDGELLPDDARRTAFGQFLRSTSLDELPELINIIKGDMSIVGPRPLLVKYLDHYNSHDARRHEVRPGLTGWAQVCGRNTMSWKEKFEKDIEYVDNLTFLMDFKVVILTAKKVFAREGIEFREGHQSIMEYFEEHKMQETDR